MFTREQIEEIKSKLQLGAKKDTQFNDAQLPVNGLEEIAFIQNGINVKMKLKDLVDNLLLFRASDFINISENFNKTFTLEEAIKFVSPPCRKIGVVITYIDSNLNDWVIFQFKGTSKKDWFSIEYWKSLLNEGKFKGYYINKCLLEAVCPTPEIGDYAFVGENLGSSKVYRCINQYTWDETLEFASDYVKIIIDGNITVGANGNWYQNNVDTGIKAQGPKGEFPYLRFNASTGDLEYSYNNSDWFTLINKLEIKGEAASIRIANTIDVPYYESAKIENIGTIYDAILKFSLRQGNPGTKGEKGDGFTPKAFISTPDLLPTQGQVLGDTYIVGSTSPYDIYMYNGSSFVNLGPATAVKAGVIDGGRADSVYGGARTFDCGKA